MQPFFEEPLEEHLKRVEHYMRGCELLRFPREKSPLRTELAAFIRERATEIINEWIALIAPVFPIPAERIPETTRDMYDALLRWARHIEDPHDIETYVYLHEHARHGFIAHSPASRFLAGQMKVRLLIVERLREAYAKDRKRLVELLTLLDQEFYERLLHITDFFVEAREEALSDEEESHRKALNNAPAPIFKISCQTGAILRANREAEKVTGFSQEELKGRPIWELHPSDEKDQLRQLCQETNSHGYLSREDLRLITKEGGVVPVSVYFGTIEHRGEKTIQGIYVDVSDRKRLESQLIQSEKMAAIGQLAAGIAHEIRNPLGIIMNALYDLSEILNTDNPEVREDLQIAKDEIVHAQEIITNLLEFSRESGAEMEEVNLNDLLRKTLQLMHKYLQTNNVKVITSLGKVGTCLANQNALRQVFLNLITNAVQAMPHGGELRLRTQRNATKNVLIEFSDTGVGIPEHHLSSIFNPFFTTKEPGQGTGLGLSVVHSVIKRYEGNITVQSKPNVGTTFLIELPCPCASDKRRKDKQVAEIRA
ncbi:MAG: PAS domain S-box protein [Deltaproteobacteria bacterium]|nr:PAS domain S-box protein [Deltaproteobacteria bacterium]